MTFRAPGAGLWRRDDTYLPHPPTPYFMALLVPAHEDGLGAGFALVGSLMEGFDTHVLGGRAYSRARIVGAPRAPFWGDGPAPAKAPKPAGLPPRWLMRLLFKLHPAMRRRARRAAEVFATRAWREHAERWRSTDRAAARALNLRLQAVALAELRDGALADHLDEVTRAAREGMTAHLRTSPLWSVAIGDFLVEATRHGAPIEACVEALSGVSHATVETAAHAAKVAAALDAEARAHLADAALPAAARLERLRASPSVAAALDAWLDEHGWRLVSGIDLSDLALVELPETMLAAIDAAGARRGDVAGARAEAARASVLGAVPASERARVAALADEARQVADVREDDVAILWAWRTGLVRRALLEVGRRLAASGRIAAAAHVFEASPAEALALLRGASAPPAATLVARAEMRRGWEALDAPLELGADGPMPPDDWLPPAVARMTRAAMTFLGHMHAGPKKRAAAAALTAGTAASGGGYVGRARLVEGAADFARVRPGDVLVARLTLSSFNVLLPLVGAIVTDRGGLLSHAALVAREFGLPAVVGCGDATRKISDGQWIRVDGDRGEVWPATPEQSTAVDDLRRSTMVDDRAATAEVPPPRPRGEGACVALEAAGDAARFGGKAAALASAARAGLPVPAGLALDVDRVERVAAGERAALPDPAAWPVAVRSSALDEDGARASFAGQHLSVLGVADADALAQAIAAVRASAYSPGARAYRRRMGIGDAPGMAVVVQAMVPADVAGVTFTSDGTRVIEAVRGLGDQLVSGHVTPERWRIGAGGEVLERFAGDGGPCLDATEVAALVALVDRCDAHFGAPQDIEWAFAGGRLHLLQSRPVTAALPALEPADESTGS